MIIDDFLDGRLLFNDKVASSIINELDDMPKYKRLIYLSCFNHQPHIITGMYDRYDETKYVENYPYINFKYANYIYLKQLNIYRKNMNVCDITNDMISKEIQFDINLKFNLSNILNLIRKDENIKLDISLCDLLGKQPPSTNIQDFI